MAVVLGNMMQKKEEKEMLENNTFNRKLETLKNLIKQAEETLIPKVVDIYDTYFEVKKIDEKFKEKLWDYLCCHYEGVAKTIDINSHFAFHAGITKGKRLYCQNVSLSRYGVSVSYGVDGRCATSKTPEYDCNNNDKNVWRGKYLLVDYLNDNKARLTERYIDGCIAELETLIDNFPIYADGFFKKVSNYEI